MTQTKWFIEQMKEAGAPFEFEIKEMVTKGDRILDVSLSKLGGQGVFVKEIQEALFNKEIDFAVHSMKDLPAELPEGLMIGCIPPRVDARDALISTDHVKLMDLPAGSVVGTSSLRRSAQLLLMRPDLEVKWIRGTIEARLEQLREGEYDAIILAAAGMQRVGWDDEIVTEFFSAEDVVPSVGQGALAIECRSDDKELLDELAKVNDPTSWDEVTAERTFLSEMDGSDHVPIGAYAQLEAPNVKVTGFIASPDGKQVFKHTVVHEDPVQAGLELAKVMRAEGANKVIEKVLAELENENK